MILISKEEKDVISKAFPDAHIVRTMKQKSNRHRYYCEESNSVMKYLNEARVCATSETSGGAAIGYCKAK